MRPIAFILAASIAAPTFAFAQAPAAAKKDDPVLATVNGRPIAKSQIAKVMGQIDVGPDGTAKEAYDVATDLLVNTELLLQFLNDPKNGVTISPGEIDKEMTNLDAELKEKGESDLATYMAKNSITPEALKEQLQRAKLWEKYCTGQGTEPVLKAFVEKNKDFFNGATVRARHILLKTTPEMTTEQKEGVKAKLLEIKKQIDGGQLDFVAAANKFSEDEGNIEAKTGGDLGTFRRRGDLVEEFAAAAFGLKPGIVSDPVETAFGYHLILVSEHNPGTPIDFEKQKQFIFSQYELDLRERLLTEAKKGAKIEIKPMPEDLIPEAAPEPAGASPAGEKPAKP